MRSRACRVVLGLQLVAAALLIPDHCVADESSAGVALTLTREPGESIRDFAARSGPAGATLEKVVPGRRGWGGMESFVAFYRLGSDEESSGADLERVTAYVFFRAAPDGAYKTGPVGSCGWEGGPPTLDAVFFADVGASTRMFLICSWAVVHLDVRGRLYATHEYEPPVATEAGVRVKGGENPKLSGGCDCDGSGGSKRAAKYKTERTSAPPCALDAERDRSEHDRELATRRHRPRKGRKAPTATRRRKKGS